MSTEICNNKPGWNREVEDLGSDTKYVIDSKLNRDGSLNYHEYNVYEDGSHTHIHGTIRSDGTQKINGGHGEEKRPWKW